MENYLDLLRVLRQEDLVENVAPIQLGIRLLIPEGSRLLELDEVRTMLEAFDAKSLVYPWKNVDSRLDALSETVQAIAADADHAKETRSAAFDKIWSAAHSAAGLAVPEFRPVAKSRVAVPFLSEPWYCCAEPTRDQLVSIGSVRQEPAAPVTAADAFI
jgi:hypothetical protein